MLPFNKCCELEDFADHEIRSVIKDVSRYKIPYLGPEFPAGGEHCKDWEVAMSLRTFKHFGVLRPDAKVLGVAAGKEDTIFYLTNRVNQVFATDRYLSSLEWEETASTSMLSEPEPPGKYAFDRQRLVVQHMDGRSLGYPDDTFDGIFSSGSIEHFGELDDVAAAAYEMGRVLKPGGVLSLSTVIRTGGPAEGNGFPGTLVMSLQQIKRYIVEASGLEPLDEISTEVSEATRATERELKLAIEFHDKMVSAQPEDDPTPEFVCWEFPHIILSHEGYAFDSIHLALEKKESSKTAKNAWARPSPRILDSIRRENTAPFNRKRALVASSDREVPAQDLIDPQVILIARNIQAIIKRFPRLSRLAGAGLRMSRRALRLLR